MHSLVSFFLLTVEIIPPTTSSDRLLGLICLLMFFAGIWLACPEVVKWWKARMGRLFAPSSVKDDRTIEVSTHEDRAISKPQEENRDRAN